MKLSILIRTLRQHMNGWLAASLIGAACILLPIFYVLSGLFRPANENWGNVKQYLIADYAAGSLKLVLGTGLSATLLGVALAWLVVGYRFPFSRFFKWAMVLPLAVPPYIAAYTYSTMTSYTGTVQASLRNGFGIAVPPGLIEVMSARGAIFILTICLFPYVFMIMRSYLERQSASYIENARLLGRKRLSLFFRVVIPISRPAIIAGSMLVVFEVLSDYGVASFFGVQTLSTAIFQTWFGMYDVDSALRLAAWLMVAVISVYMLERFFRRNRKFHSTTSQSRPFRPVLLQGTAAWGAFAACGFIFLVSFVLPVLQIAVWTVWTFEKVWRADFLELLRNSLTGAAVATIAIMTLALLTAKSNRLLSSSVGYAISRLMTAGYAIPGAVIAIGVLAVFIALDRWLSPLYIWLGKPEGALVLSMSLVMLICGYVIRFVAAGFNAVDAGYEKIPRSFSEAARTLGSSTASCFVRVELPLLMSAIFTGFVLTFVEVIKELPLTLLLRPFNFDTLATRTYQYAMDERIFEAAPPSLLLIGIGLVSVVFILKLEKGRTR